MEIAPENCAIYPMAEVKRAICVAHDFVIPTSPDLQGKCGIPDQKGMDRGGETGKEYGVNDTNCFRLHRAR